MTERRHNAPINPAEARARHAARLFCEATQQVVRARGGMRSIQDQVGWNELDATEKQMLVDTFQ